MGAIGAYLPKTCKHLFAGRSEGDTMKGKKIVLPQLGEVYIAEKAFFNAGRLFPKGAIFNIDDSNCYTIVGGLQKNKDDREILSFVSLRQFRRVFRPANP